MDLWTLVALISSIIGFTIFIFQVSHRVKSNQIADVIVTTEFSPHITADEKSEFFEDLHRVISRRGWSLEWNDK